MAGEGITRVLTEVQMGLCVFQDLEATFQKYLEDLQHMNDHIPAHMPWSRASAR